MVGDNYSITVAEGGFMVHVNRVAEQSTDGAVMRQSYVHRVFADSSTLINYLHNEFAGSN